jgi:D-alanyl-D-alanine carboxypeptidase/D-alanyl-D-alanine-endopeptidase (penicillin-binding protein 4)
MDYLSDVVGADGAGLRVDDGSGLSKRNRATPASFVQLLAHVAGSGHADEFWATLPEAGSRLELPRMYRTPAAGNLRAKTGTINRVSALSGVVKSAGGEAVLFSIVSNEVPNTNAAKRIEDLIGVCLASFSRESPTPTQGLAMVEYGEYGPRLRPALAAGALPDAGVLAARR